MSRYLYSVVGMSLISVSWLMMPSPVLAGGLLGDLINQIQIPLDSAGKSLDEAHRNIKQSIPEYGSIEAQAEIVKAQAALVAAEAKQREVETRFAELARASSQIEKEKEELTKSKSDLEAREKLFSMGFYASFTTSLLAILGLVVKLPTSRLDKQLKLLEIQDKELSLKERAAKLEASAKPNTSLNADAPQSGAPVS